MSASGVNQILHLLHADLIETSGKDIDDVAVMRYPFGQVLVELLSFSVSGLQYNLVNGSAVQYLHSFFVILDIVTVDVMVRPHWFFQLRPNHETWAFSRRSAGKEHDASSRMLE